MFEFIHSTTSKGVIVSNLAERYWYLAFVQARPYFVEYFPIYNILM